MSDTPKGFTPECNAECFEYGGNAGCPVWTHGENDIHPDFTADIPERQPTGEAAYVRNRQRPSESMGVVGGGNLPLDTVKKIADRWGGMVVVPRDDDDSSQSSTIGL